jgi:hypothetical protein
VAVSVAVSRDIVNAEQTLTAGKPAESTFFIEPYQLGHPVIAPL